MNTWTVENGLTGQRPGKSKIGRSAIRKSQKCLDEPEGVGTKVEHPGNTLNDLDRASVAEDILNNR